MFNKTIETFCSKLKFNDTFKKRFGEIILEEWEKREKSLSGDTVNLHQNISAYETEIQNIKDKIKVVSSATVIKMLEDDIDSLENKKLQANVVLSKKENEQLNVQVVINQVRYYMEHLEELLLGGTEPLKNAALFGLIFDEPPTYDELVNGTPKLAPIFALNDAYEASEEQFVNVFDKIRTHFKSSC